MQPSLVLPAELTIYTITELHSRWLGMLTEDLGQTLPVDASAVAEVDAAGVQLLLSLANALALRHCTLSLAPVSAALSAACGALGVSHLLATAELAGAAQ